VISFESSSYYHPSHRFGSKHTCCVIPLVKHRDCGEPWVQPVVHPLCLLRQVNPAEFHTVYTTSNSPSCYFYVYINSTAVTLQDQVDAYAKKMEAGACAHLLFSFQLHYTQGRDAFADIYDVEHKSVDRILCFILCTVGRFMSPVLSCALTSRAERCASVYAVGRCSIIADRDSSSACSLPSHVDD